MGNEADAIKLFREAALDISGRRLDNLTMECPLADLGLDSVLVLEIVSHVEQSLGVRFDDDDLAYLSTIKDLHNLILKASKTA